MPSSDPNCLFCKIIKGDIPSTVVYEDAKVFAFNDIHPDAPTHVLIISKTHTASHLETDDVQLYADIMQGAKIVAKQLGLSDYRLVMNNGAGAGQSVFHMHLHLLAGHPFTSPAG